MTVATPLPPPALLAPDPRAGRVALRVWLRDWVRWLRGPQVEVRAVLARLDVWLSALEADPVARGRLAQAWQAWSAQGINAVNRQRIQQALAHRWRKAPGSFLWPPADDAPPRA